MPLDSVISMDLILLLETRQSGGLPACAWLLAASLAAPQLVTARFGYKMAIMRTQEEALCLLRQAVIWQCASMEVEVQPGRMAAAIPHRKATQ